MIPTRLATLADLPFSRGGEHHPKRTRSAGSRALIQFETILL